MTAMYELQYHGEGWARIASSDDLERAIAEYDECAKSGPWAHVRLIDTRDGSVIRPKAEAVA